MPDHVDLDGIIQALDPAGPPRAVIVRRAPHGVGPTGGRLGILSASFNPLTATHARLAALARERYRLDEVMLLLARANVDKEVTGAGLANRVRMMERYAEGRPHMSVAVCSHGRFVDKAQALGPHFPGGTEFWFILGYDTLVRLFDAKYYADRDADLRRLFSVSRIIAANRGDRGEEAVRDLLHRAENRPFAGGVHFLLLDEWHARVSSTEVRRRVARGEPIADLVPAEVAAFIEARRLYREQEERGGRRMGG